MSTEAQVRTQVVNLIKGIYSTLGFDEYPGNVKEYLLELEVPEQRGAYLSATVESKKVVRAWAVQVVRLESNETEQATRSGEYEVTIVGYYDWTSGIANTMLDHASAIRGEIYKRVNTSLGGTVDYITDSTAVSFEEVGSEIHDNLLAISFSFSAFVTRAST